jgi:hypothetical protein
MPTLTADYVPRALAAWYRGSSPGSTRPLPHHALCAQVTLDTGKSYVLLANSYHVLGVYRIRPQGVLRRLKCWPKAVETAAGWPQDERTDA